MPTQQEIDELVSFLPQLYAEGFSPIEKWGGGEEVEDGVFTAPWPEYKKIVEEFYRLASKSHWADYDYRPEEAARMLDNHDAIKTADVDQLKTMLTYCVRGERFCDGHWAMMIESGNIRRLLQRLAAFGSETA